MLNLNCFAGPLMNTQIISKPLDLFFALDILRFGKSAGWFSIKIIPAIHDKRAIFFLLNVIHLFKKCDIPAILQLSAWAKLLCKWWKICKYLAKNSGIPTYTIRHCTVHTAYEKCDLVGTENVSSCILEHFHFSTWSRKCFVNKTVNTVIFLQRDIMLKPTLENKSFHNAKLFVFSIIYLFIYLFIICFIYKSR